MPEQWETREQLLAAAEAAKHPISPSQLGRLHRAGLIDEPKVRALGRGRGTESRYPAGTAARLVRVLQVHAREHRLTPTAWRLWWEDGGPLPPAAGQVLARAARTLEEQRQQFGALLAGDETNDPAAQKAMDELYADAEHQRLRGVLAEARSNVGRERFASVIRTLGEVTTGQFTSDASDGDPDSSVRLLERALGFAPARTDTLGASKPWLQGELGQSLSALSEMFVSRSIVDLTETDNLQLDLARIEIQSLIETLTAVAWVLERLHGRGAFGIGMLSRLLNAQTPHNQALVLLGWLFLRSDPTLRAGLEQIGALEPRAVATMKLYEVISQLREEIPALAPVMSDVRLAAAQRDEIAAAELNAEIARVRETDTASFDAFFAAHPEVQQLTAVVEAGNVADAQAEQG